jgi:hypothetical protein
MTTICVQGLRRFPDGRPRHWNIWHSWLDIVPHVNLLSTSTSHRAPLIILVVHDDAGYDKIEQGADEGQAGGPVPTTVRLRL